MKKKYKRRKSLKKTIQEINVIKKSVPKIIFRAKNLVVTLKNKEQIKKWIELYPDGTYQIN
jgi:hypothetical protein